ncbi:hypothetical protein KO481_25715 [Nocardia sp. NEAU-G5]|uniref:Antitoxin VbhA domain-containing protein n=1 Tax=Nocardia albiluteola TaxID=2842303 RepID=A0ABS6B6E7_9NOCA|nr:hypothetical protein [Nocardia albiluteola]MBU3064915.1 hypothetical protein [Nocardia albiluteola]
MQDVEPGVLTGTAASWSGLISVETTELGLPLSVDVDRSELQRDPADLAAELVRLCGQAANRARLARRAELAEAGVTRDVLDRLGLATAEEVAEAEYAQEAEYEYVPRTWRSNGGV